MNRLSLPTGMPVLPQTLSSRSRRDIYFCRRYLVDSWRGVTPPFLCGLRGEPKLSWQTSDRRRVRPMDHGVTTPRPALSRPSRGGDDLLASARTDGRVSLPRVAGC